MTSLTQEILELEMQLKCIREEIIGEWKDETCLKDVMKTVQSTKEQLVDAFGKSLHMLGKFKPKERTVETVVKKFPDSLKIGGRKNRLPIQTCVWYGSHHAKKYIPLLAREGMKHNAGGEESRGGLLTVDPSSKKRSNTLQLVLGMKGNSATKEFDEGIVKVLESLKKDGLLKKKDVSEYNLISHCAWKGCQMRFKYLLQIDPESISSFLMDGETFMHCLINSRKDVCHFKAVLKVTLELHPEQAGYLFQKNPNGQKTAVERAIRRYGEKETMTALHEIFSQTSFPILHHALIQAPKFKDAFMEWFPWAFHLKDHDGRSLIQIILATGANCVKEYRTVFASMSDDQICEKDPVTTLYPFAAVASDEDGDLEKCFYLLRRQPGVLDRSQPRSAEQVTTAGGRKKRKRDDSD